MGADASQNFREICRQWRQFRKLSQLDLALEANVSQRHVSWLETGRSQPSREMVVRLSEAMDIPLRKRNSFLQAAGYAAAYTESQLDDPGMKPVLKALTQVLKHHDPLPAIVVDRFWNMKMKNKAAELLLSLSSNPEAMMIQRGKRKELNVALLTLHPEGFRPYIKNWDQAAPAFIRRLKSESIASGDPELQAQFAEFLQLAGPVDDSYAATENLLPVLPLELKIGEVELSVFSAISTFGTPQDVTTDELRIEAFYPTDDKTEAFFRSMA